MGSWFHVSVRSRLRHTSGLLALGLLSLGLLSLGLAPAACRPRDAERAATQEPTNQAVDAGAPEPAAAPLAAAAPAPPPKRAEVEGLLVPGDLQASIVRGPDAAAPVTVFMPGICSNANAYLQAFPEAARNTGGVVAIEGDQPCAGVAGFRSFSWDASRQHARVEAVLAAAGLTEIPREGITLVGYSQGAALAEQMVQRWPGRYARVVLIGAPTDPSPKSFARARAVVTMSCDRDVPSRMKQAAAGAAKAGTPATYFEMPGCTHGNLTDGDRVFDAAFDWLRVNERAPDPRATVVRIAGGPS